MNKLKNYYFITFFSRFLTFASIYTVYYVRIYEYRPPSNTRYIQHSTPILSDTDQIVQNSEYTIYMTLQKIIMKTIFVFPLENFFVYKLYVYVCISSICNYTTLYSTFELLHTHKQQKEIICILMMKSMVMMLMII